MLVCACVRVCECVSMRVRGCVHVHVHVRMSMHLCAFTVLGGIDNFEIISSMYLQNAGIHCLTHGLHCCEIPPAPNHEFMHTHAWI